MNPATSHTSGFDRVTEALYALGSRRGPSGDWNCPAHDDRTPSLSVNQGADGRVLLHCHAGCSLEDVLAPIALTVRDLFIQPLVSMNGHAATPTPPRVVARYDYTDERGEMLFQVERLEPKGFRQRRPDGFNGWVPRLGDVRRVLYHLPEVVKGVAAGDMIYVVEGEKDADALRAVDQVATCNPGGTGGGWRSEYTDVLRGADVVIVRDRDKPGEAHAQKVATALAGIAKSVRIVEAKEGKDAADHLEAKLGVEDFVQVWPELASPSEEPTASGEAHDRDGAHWHDLDDEHADHGLDQVQARLAENLTDLGNAKRLVRLHGLDLRFSHPMRRWFVWDGRRFAVDDAGEIYRRAKQTVTTIYAEASIAPTVEEREKLSRHARRSESEHAIDAMIALARTEPGISIAIEALDADPFLFNVLNGTIELNTGRLREHRREDLLSKLAPIAYDQHAHAPVWEATLERILPDPATRTFFQRAVGYSMTGSTSEQKLFIAHGRGANGKSTVLETLRDALGDYAMHSPGDTLLARRETGIPNDVARLRGGRLITVIETEDGQRLAESRVKSLTGGDMIAARYMRGEWFEFRLIGKLWLATNHRPSVRGTDLAIWRRIRLIPFTVTIPEHERDPDLRDKLRAELPGILAWAVRGCLDWQSQGLGAPEQVVNATAEYRADEDVLGRFFEEKCGQGKGREIGATELYDAFKLWAQAANESDLSMKRFGSRLRERGFDTSKNPSTRRAVWLGIDLLPQEPTR